MDEIQTPQGVRVDLITFFDDVHEAEERRIGLVTRLTCDDDFVTVTGVIGNYDLHDVLAERVDPSAEKNIELPGGMYSKWGTVRAWYDAQQKEPFGVVAGQVFNDVNMEPEMTYEQTARCIRMAGLALCELITIPPDGLAKRFGRGRIIFGKFALEKIERNIGECVFE